MSSLGMVMVFSSIVRGSMYVPGYEQATRARRSSRLTPTARSWGRCSVLTGIFSVPPASGIRPPGLWLLCLFPLAPSAPTLFSASRFQTSVLPVAFVVRC